MLERVSPNGLIYPAEPPTAGVIDLRPFVP